MSRTRLRAAVVLLLGFALVASACGDDDDTTTTGGASGDGSTTGVLQFTPYDAGGPLTEAALKSGEIDVAVLFTTNPNIASEGWVLLEDDKGLQPAENLIPAMRDDIATPQIDAALAAVSEKLTTEELSELNRQQSQDKIDSDEIAAAWLEEQGLVPYDGEPVTGSLTIGSTNFGEQEIVAELYAQVLESAGASIERRFKLGNREIVSPALQNGEIDLYPEYVASFTYYLDPDAVVPANVDDAVEQLRELASAVGVVLGKPAPAEDKNGFVVTRATADELGLRTVSDLARVPVELVLGGPPECPTRPLCGIGLQETYGITVKT
ncbi:MAG TPA: glycine betaine ABC transporter substrate-binding protein [Acidimicrobiales bacterium]